MDVVSAIASIIALVQLADRVVDLSSTYIGHARGAEKEVIQIITTITGLKGFLEFLEKFLKSTDADRLPALLSQCCPNGPLELCTKRMEEISSKLERRKRGVGRALAWPFKRKDITESLEFIEKQKSSLSLAMQGNTLQTTLNIELAVNNIEAYVHTQAEKEMLKWLYKVDPFENHSAARTKWEPGTGEWFTSSHEFTSWLLPGRSLWLYGIPGAGKTVLCSTIVESIKERLGRFPLCFYFDYRDQRKQSVVNMLYTVLAQLSEDGVPSEIQELYKMSAHGTRDATIGQLKETFLSIAKRIASGRHTTYLVLDALDECEDREILLGVMAEICQSASINVLTTSRPEQDISSVLKEIVTYNIPIQNEKVNEDIKTHIQTCLKNDHKLRKWDDEAKILVANRLTYKANGMFRWVECLLEILRKCYTKRALLQALDSLPKTLDSTYERILFQIPEEYAHYASAVFNLLSCHSFRVGIVDYITLVEAAEIIAIDLASDSYDAQNRLNDPSDILSICSTLLILEPRYASWASRFAKRPDPNEPGLSFSHLSVKEYLESDRAPPSFRITPDGANAMIARISLVILLYAELSSPFFDYAKIYWLLHAKKLNQKMYMGLEPLVQRLFDDSNMDRFRIWTSRTCSHRDHLPSVTDSCQVPSWVSTAANRLYHASRLGFPSICRTFIAKGANVNKRFDSHSGPLAAACVEGHKVVIELLLDHGADPDPKLANRVLHIPLSAACRFGDPAVVQLLLEKIVDINVKTLRLSLLEAVRSGAVEIVNLILERGAELNFREVGDIDPLLDMISDVRCYATVTPLLLAIKEGHEQVVQLLVKNGADVNYEGGVGEFPLALAVQSKNEKIVELLLQHGADINRGWDGWDNVLEGAIAWGNPDESIMRVLLAHVSRLDVENLRYDSAHKRALGFCSESVIQLFEAAGFPRCPRWERPFYYSYGPFGIM